MRLLIFLTLFSCFCFSFANAENTLKTRLQNAQVGDYIVTKSGKTVVLVLIKELSEEHVVIEEISFEEEKLKAPFSWQTWLNQNAPHHTSWTLFQIDLTQNKLVECFSVAKNTWLSIRTNQNFFSEILALPMTSLPKEQCRKIGPAPASRDEVDNRPLWKPALIINGKKQANPQFTAFETTWPNDNTVLAQSRILLYFSDNAFPFPFWTEIANGFYTLRVPTIDSGKNLVSNSPKMPKRVPLVFPTP